MKMYNMKDDTYAEVRGAMMYFLNEKEEISRE
jgi:hypothetical protein